VFNPFNEDKPKQTMKKPKRFTRKDSILSTDIVQHQLGSYRFSLYESDKEKIQRVNWQYQLAHGYVTNIGTSLEPQYVHLNTYILDFTPDVRVYPRNGDSTDLTRRNLRARYQAQSEEQVEPCAD
jgi:hypothetical protein